jgi:serine/threonine protein kinase
MKYHIGGCLSAGDPTYIERDADRELLENLKSGEFCYVFNARQTGKSSLRDRAAEELKKEGWACVTVNLQKIGGDSTTINQFYAGFLEILIKGVGIDLNPSKWLNKWINDNKNISPVQWVTKAIEQTIVPKLINDGKNLVIFIDEIDNILELLDFSLGDFWGLVRSCYETERAEYGQIQFVTLGVTTTKEISSDKYSILNIGKAIELSGFTSLQMRRLLPGLDRQPSNIDLFLNKIHEYTGGQPFLTQKVFKLIQDSSIIDIDSLEEIESLIYDQIVSNWEYEERDSPVHLVTIRDRLLEREFAVEILILYKKILEKQQIVYDDSDFIHQRLRLSGVVVKEGSILRIYNNIYKQVFDREWTISQLKNKGCMRGRYKRIDKIGKGGFGETFLVQDLQMPGNPYRLLKKFLPQDRDESVIRHAHEYFQREATILDNLRHDRIPRIYDFFEEDGEFYLVMEYINGATLAEVLSSEQLMSESDVINLLEDVLQILTYLHESPFGEVGTQENKLNISYVIHRDIKPSNIIRRERDGKLVLIDFGAVKQISQISSRNQNRNPSTLAFNSGDYTPPEQYRGTDPRPQSDIYALGIVGLEALTGKTSDDGYTTQSATNKSISGSSDLREILDKMTRARINDRYQSAREVLADLAKLKQKAINANPIPTTIVIPSTRKSQFNKWTKRLIPALLGMILVVSALHIWECIYPPERIPDSALTIDLLSATDVDISNGSKEILDRKTLTGTFKTLKDQAIKDFINKNYKEAYEKFYKLRQNSMPIDSPKSVIEKNPDAPAARKDNQLLIDMNNAAVARKDPQLLIYMNNAKVRYLQKKNKNVKIYTIAAAFPTGEERGEQALYGIAHLQHNVVNPKKKIEDLKDMKKMESFLNDTPDVYLEILIANDENKTETAKKLADKLTKGFINDVYGKQQPILATIGHYRSESSCEALPIYSQAKLPLISPLSTVTEFRYKCGDNNGVFFRTPTSSKLEAKALADEVEKYKKRSSNNNPKIIVFYKSGTNKDYSQDLFDTFNTAINGKDKLLSFNLDSNDSFAKGREEIKDADIIILFPDGKNAGGNVSDEKDRNFKNAIKVLTKAKEENKKNYLILGSNPLLTSLDPQDKELNSLMPYHTNKLILAVDWSEDIGNEDFIKEYNNLWGGSLNRTTSLSYEDAQVLSKVLLDLGKNNVAITHEEIISALKNLKNNPVKSDVFNKDKDKYISFDEKGDRVGIDERILVTPDRSGKFVRYPIPTPTLP